MSFVGVGRRRRAAVLSAAALLVLLSGCATASNPNDYVDLLFSSRELQKPAAAECAGLLAGSTDSGVELVAARNETLAKAAELFGAMGVDPEEDPNIEINPGTTPISLCAFEDPERLLQLPGTRVVMYRIQGDNGTGIVFYE